MPGLSDVVRQFPDASFVSISNDQRQPLRQANWGRTIYHGLSGSVLSQATGLAYPITDILFVTLGGGNPGGPPIERPEEVGERARVNRSHRIAHPWTFAVLRRPGPSIRLLWTKPEMRTQRPAAICRRAFGTTSSPNPPRFGPRSFGRNHG